MPLLDHRLLEFAASLPPGFKVQGRKSKHVLKAAFAGILPAEVIHRRKAGFPVPVCTPPGCGMSLRQRFGTPFSRVAL